MIKTVLELIRNTPGPLKKPRVIFADLTEEIIDIAKSYMEQEGYMPSETPDDATPAQAAPPVAQAAKPTPSKSKTKSTATAPKKTKAQETLQVEPDFQALVDNPKFNKKQDFKVLAILMDANQRNLGPLSAKEASGHGEKIGLFIRHENVRKVIRLRLDKKVETHKSRSSTGNATVYRYQLSRTGVEFFKNTYLNP